MHISGAARRLAIMCLLALGTQLIGCSTAYWRNRLYDASDIITSGLIVTPRLRPDFGLRIDPFMVVPIGYSSIDGVLLGWANRQFGVMTFKDNSWGAIAWGTEYLRIGEFNPNDPHQAPPGMIARLKEAGEPLPQEPSPYTVGFVGLHYAERGVPWPMYGSCPKVIPHLGWIGFYLGCSPLDMVDFVLGWSGYDFVGDDLAE